MNRKASIVSPCSEDWNQMTPSQKGRYCDKCKLEVVDFTNKSSNEIVEYLDNAPDRVCGRMKTKPLNYLKYAGLLSTLILGSLNTQAVAQGEIGINDSKTSDQLDENGNLINHVELKSHVGTVVNNHNEPVPFAKVWLNGAPRAITDIDGRFKLDIKPHELKSILDLQIVNSIEYSDTIEISFQPGDLPLVGTYIFQEKQEIQMMLGVMVAEPRRHNSFGEFGNEEHFDFDEDRPSGRRSNKRR